MRALAVRRLHLWPRYHEAVRDVLDANKPVVGLQGAVTARAKQKLNSMPMSCRRSDARRMIKPVVGLQGAVTARAKTQQETQPAREPLPRVQVR